MFITSGNGWYRIIRLGGGSVEISNEERKIKMKSQKSDRTISILRMNFIRRIIF
jgi:hypothetical protein